MGKPCSVVIKNHNDESKAKRKIPNGMTHLEKIAFFSKFDPKRVSDDI